jgi:Mannosyl-glycoprotein endo-beta-N-acetylglucosaminidase
VRRLLLKTLLPGAFALCVVIPSVAQARATLATTRLTATAAGAPDLAATTAAAPELAATADQTAAGTVFAQPIADAETVTAVADQMDAAAPTADLSIATVVAPKESHLPGWVQVVVATASMYSADSASDQVLAKLPRHAFLRVIEGGSSRLEVQAYDDSGNPAQTGWVSADQVLPSAPGTDWLVAATATTLWTSADSSAASVRNLDRFAPLLRLDGPQLNRIRVRVYRSDFSAIVIEGWVDVSDAGPALPPQSRVAAPSDPSLTTRVASSTEQQAAFMSAAAQAARQGAALTGVPASVSVAQAILESDWGRSTLAQGANNYFGMKAMGTLGNDGVVWMPTSEYDDSGQLYQTTSAFRAYKSLADSLADHDRLLSTLSRYAPAMHAASDPKAFASAIAKAGYSTDPAYADKLVALMDKYNLYTLDA